jgi:2'-5' RNA ligase
MGRERFSCEASGLGYFGRPGRPRVIWAGLNAAANGLAAIHLQLCPSIKNLGVPYDDSPFIPHLTIGRIRSPGNTGELVSQIDACKDEHFGCMDVGELILFRSDLEAGGSVYTVLHRSAFIPVQSAG